MTDNLWSMPNKDAETLYVDVDNTLLMWHHGIGRGTPEVNVNTVEEIQNWRGPVYLWSRGGKEHALHAAEYCGLQYIIAGCMGKPTKCIDDDINWFGRRVSWELPNIRKP